VRSSVVAIDTLPLSRWFRYTGTGVYLSNLLSECLRIAAAGELNVEFHGFMAPNDNWASNGYVSPFLRVHKSALMAQRRLWFLGGMAMNVARVRPDLVFLPTAQSSIPNPFVPLVSAILDAIPQRLPSTLVEASMAAHWVTWMSAKLACRVITISECSKKDLVEIYGLAPEKIEVTYLGYDRKFYNEVAPNPEASATLLGRLGVRKPYVLHHGMVQLRKNVQRLIQAWDRVVEGNKSFDTQLVLAGPMGLGHEEILKARELSANRNQIILTGELPNAELAVLVKNASLCVIPSLYEGFCLPLVEAMACGVPTIASQSSCIPEISGGVLEYFDPFSVEEMAESIRRALQDSELRARLRDRGLARAAEFSWERCARETLRIFVETHEQHHTKRRSASPYGRRPVS
jgi:glycosyltransferase involved in cell wall biosynthesis